MRYVRMPHVNMNEKSAALPIHNANGYKARRSLTVIESTKISAIKEDPMETIISSMNTTRVLRYFRIYLLREFNTLLIYMI